MLYPIGIQTFEEVREEGYVYVDKTMFISKLLSESKFIFLSRPRRFGKSMMLSTLDAYFSGRRELFEGLAIAEIEKDWKKHPVMRFDFNIADMTSANGLRSRIDTMLSKQESKYGVICNCKNLSDRFEWVISEAHRLTGEKVVILVDEYEKPILEAIGNRELQDEFRAILKPFYGCLKTCDEHIRFAMLTGVTKYGHLSVFSDLNNLVDISLKPKFADICGITHQELKDTFAESIHEFAEAEGVSDEELFGKLVSHYDSYRFSKKDLHVFNPFSLLNALKDQEFRDYWFMSGTPSFLIKLVRDQRIQLPSLEKYVVPERGLVSVDIEYRDAISILYQSGYLTIKKFDSEDNSYTIGYPNMEVRRGFLNNVLEIYNGHTDTSNFNIVRDLVIAVRGGHPEAMMRKVEALFADVPYSREETRDEFWFRDMVYLMFNLLGYRVQVEKHISTGRIDCVIETTEYVYVMEFKYDKSPEEALEQIEKQGYAAPFENSGRKVYKIGVNYNPANRRIESLIKP